MKETEKAKRDNYWGSASIDDPLCDLILERADLIDVVQITNLPALELDSE